MGLRAMPYSWKASPVSLSRKRVRPSGRLYTLDIEAPDEMVCLGFSRAWSIVLGATGIFHGIFGAAHLFVILDRALLPGGVMIVLTVFARTHGGRGNTVEWEWVFLRIQEEKGRCRFFEGN